MLPPIFGVLPNFILMKQLGWVYTWNGLLAPYVLMNPFAIFFLRQFFLNIPQEIEEAARLDGLGRWGIFRRIWNEYLWPQLITNGSHAQVLHCCTVLLRLEHARGSA